LADDLLDALSEDSADDLVDALSEVLLDVLVDVLVDALSEVLVDDLSDALSDDLSGDSSDDLVAFLVDGLSEDLVEVFEVDAGDAVLVDVVAVDGAAPVEAAVPVLAVPVAGVLGGVTGVVVAGVSVGVAVVVEPLGPELPGPRPEPLFPQSPAVPAALVATDASLLGPLLPHPAAAPAVVRLVRARAKAVPRSTRQNPRPGCGPWEASGRSGPVLRTAARCGATQGERPLPSGGRYEPPGRVYPHLWMGIENSVAIPTSSPGYTAV
jgi:hypothetical protein